MSSTISWSFSAGAAGGAGLAASGTLEAAATTLAEASLDPAMPAQETLNLQLADPTKVVFLAVDCSVRDGSVEVQGTGPDAIALTGPLILFGEGVSLFANDLSGLAVQNTHATETAELTILIGRSLDV